MSPTFSYSDLLPLGEDTTKYRLVSKEGVSVVKLGDKEFLQVEPEAIAKLTEELNYTKGFLRSVQGKLSNEKFVAGAPEQVIANERKKEADALAKITGLKQTTISALEKNRINLGLVRAKILAKALKVHPAVLAFPDWEQEESAA